MSLINFKTILLIISTSVLLSGCGSEDSSNSPPSNLGISDVDIEDNIDVDSDFTSDSITFPYSGECKSQELIDNISTINSQVANGTYDCMRTWFSPSKNQVEQLFTTQVLQQINQSLLQVINQYQGQEVQAEHIYYLGEFIKAAYKNRHDTFSRELEPFPDSISIEISSTIKKFLMSPFSLTKGQMQQEALGSMLIVIDSTRQLSVTAPEVFSILDSFTQDLSESYYYRKAINNIFISMAGHSQNKSFYGVVESNPVYINKLQSFILNNSWAIGTDSEALLGNAARELSRLVKTHDVITKKNVIDTLQILLQDYPLGGKSDRVWVGIAEMVNAYAPEYNLQLGLDNSKDRLKQIVMPFSYDCLGPAQIIAQEMTDEQAHKSCQILNKIETDFHIVAATGFQPVADDYSENVDVIAFKTKDDYSTYSSFLFGNSTNNGGQFLERDPSKHGNTPRFVAYQNGWGDEFSILNLEHEYVHYLDSRFNQYGDFRTTMKEGSIVWWLEGFAEYMHYKDNYYAALSLGKHNTYSLLDVFTTSYNDDTNRIYRWGYLAVRFMLEEHPTEATQLMNLARLGQYKDWVTLLNQLGPLYDDEFQSWLDIVTENINDTDTSTPKPAADPILMALNSSLEVNGEQHSEKLYYLKIPEGLTSLELSITGSGDADMYACYGKTCHYYDYDWTNFTTGSNEIVAIPKDGNGYIKSGDYYISISGRESFNVNLEATSF